jgi:hypothetical protein
MNNWKISPTAPDMSSTDTDWDALAETGRLKPELVLMDSDQVQAVRDAEALLQSFFKAVREAGIRQEC